jgi:hypothetical protein
MWSYFISDFNVYDFAFYLVSFLLFLIYVVTLKKEHFFSFRNLSVFYYFLFSVVLGKFIYNGLGLKTSGWSFQLYALIFSYTVSLLLVATVMNVAFPNGTQNRINFSSESTYDFILLFLILVKVLLMMWELTPLQCLVLFGKVAAKQQLDSWHASPPVVKTIYTLVEPLMTVYFLYRWKKSGSFIGKIFFLFLSVESSGFYFSKFGLVIPFLIVVILSQWSLVKISLILVPIVFLAFAVRGKSRNIPILLGQMSQRLVLETGYASLHLKLINEAGQPLGFSSRRNIGFKALFGVEPKTNYMTEAYEIEHGKSGVTTSGHAMIKLYAFWGNAVYLIAPILLFLLYYADIKITERIRSEYAYVAYLYFSIHFAKLTTVNLEGLVSFAYVLMPLVWLKIALVSVPVLLNGIYRKARSAVYTEALERSC